ncbi:unnamed protein product [Ectocarpus sp. 13 AM-2016]
MHDYEYTSTHPPTFFFAARAPSLSQCHANHLRRLPTTFGTNSAYIHVLSCYCGAAVASRPIPFALAADRPVCLPSVVSHAPPSVCSTVYHVISHPCRHVPSCVAVLFFSCPSHP